MSPREDFSNDENDSRIRQQAELPVHVERKYHFLPFLNGDAISVCTFINFFRSILCRLSIVLFSLSSSCKKEEESIL